MVFNYSRTCHCLVIFASILFPICVQSTSHSPQSRSSSPDWDAILSVPINEELLYPFSQSEFIPHEEIEHSSSKTEISANAEQNTVLKPKSFPFVMPEHVRVMAVKAKPSSLSPGPDQNTKQRKQKKIFRIADLTEEQKEARRVRMKKTNAIYEKKRMERMKLPENAAMREKFLERRKKANLSYRKKLVNEVRSGTASLKRQQSYVKLLQRDRVRQQRNKRADKNSQVS
ncbi:uncharacterized protein FA14DRAFT_181596 [Meira miltonrushii]|uniref:ALMS motif domain-containing protein n=1 Tax=Meira miltonrushii TaxID=1280837 RepID=A0A316VBJ4_9BASI|nr:uncharacterized protein FA14DRAFT_181596 [Meira miltonrushii]PWN32925.1 hypothetical protein FA14DRAFT_181596 [Meira miltonrushii]